MSWIIDLIMKAINLFTGVRGLNSDTRKIKRETIIAFYPDIILDLKTGWGLFKNGFLIGRPQGNFFPKLNALDKSSELRRIRPVNEKLYNDLKRVVEEIAPAMIELDKIRIDNRKKVEQSWVDYVNQLREERAIFLRPNNVPPLVSDLSNRFYWELCAKNTAQARDIYDEWKKSPDNHFDTWGEKHNIPDDMFTNLVEIFNSHWEDLETPYNELLGKYENFIQVHLINKMSTAMEI